MKKYLLILISVINQLLMSTLAVAQIGTVSLHGVVLDSLTQEPIPFANVAVLAEGKIISGVSTDFDGYFSIKSLTQQMVSLKVDAIGYNTLLLDTLELTDDSLQVQLALDPRYTPEVYISYCFGDRRKSPKSKRKSEHVKEDDGGIGSITMCRRRSTDTYIDGVRVRGYATILGIISDSETDEPLPFVNIALLQEGKVITGGTTDFDGFYKISDLTPGDYDMHISYVGYTKEELISVQLKPGKLKELDFQLRPGLMICCVTVCEFKTALIEKDGECRRTVSSCRFHCMGSQSRCSTHSIDSLIDDSLATKSLEVKYEEQSILLYPNPAVSQITLDLLDLEEEPLSLRILDSSGRIVLDQKQVLLSRLTIPLDGLSDGVYFASFQLKDKLLTERFIVAK